MNDNSLGLTIESTMKGLSTIVLGIQLRIPLSIEKELDSSNIVISNYIICATKIMREQRTYVSVVYDDWISKMKRNDNYGV